MSDSKNVAVTRRWFEEVWNKKNDATVRELMASDAVGHLEGLHTRGHDEFFKARAYLLKAFPDFHIDIDDIIAEGEQVAVRWSVTATHQGELLGLTPTGKPVRIRGITWIRFENGKLAEGWDSWNQGQLLAELKVQ